MKSVCITKIFGASHSYNKHPFIIASSADVSIRYRFGARAILRASHFVCRYFLAAPIFACTISLPPTSLLPFTIPIESFPVKPACCRRYYRRVTLPSWLRLNDALNAHGLQRPTLISDYTGGLLSLDRVDTKKHAGRAAYPRREPLVYSTARQRNPFVWNLSCRTLTSVFLFV